MSESLTECVSTQLALISYICHFSYSPARERRICLRRRERICDNARVDCLPDNASEIGHAAKQDGPGHRIERRLLQRSHHRTPCACLHRSISPHRVRRSGFLWSQNVVVCSPSAGQTCEMESSDWNPTSTCADLWVTRAHFELLPPDLIVAERSDACLQAFWSRARGGCACDLS